MLSNVSIEDKYQEAVNLYNNGCLYEAEQLLTTLLNENNSDYDVLNFLGIIKLNSGKFKLAKEYFEQVIQLNSHHKEAYYNLGLCCQNLKEYENALQYYDKVLSVKFNHFDALNNCGAIYLDLSEYQKADSYFQICLSIKQDDPIVYNNLGNISLAKDKINEAIEYYRKALSLDLNNPLFSFNLGTAYLRLGDENSAIQHFEQAISLDPHYDDALCNIASAYTKLQNFEKAEEYLIKVNNSSKAKAYLYNNRGLSKIQQGLLFEAMGNFEEALSFQPESPEVHYNRSHIMLLNGNYEEGLREYEWRIKREDFPGKKLVRPLTADVELSGKVILIRDEQGLGDSIQFVRYIKFIKEQGAQTIFECDSRLIPLFSGLTFIDRLLSRESENSDINFDFDIHLLSLPQYFGTRLNSIHAEIPYLAPEKEYVDKWNRLIGQSSEIKAGLVWAGNPKHSNDKQRSCPLVNFLPLFDLGGIEYYILQKGAAFEQTKDILYPLNNLEAFNNSFLDAAAAIECLDLIITVDTSIAHLAGALGKETLLLVPFLPDWRWMMKNSNTPWYPSMKIFRQDQPGDWSTVIFHIKEEIKHRLNQAEQQKIPLPVSSNTDTIKDKENIYLGLSKTGNFGWGVVCKYLKEELSKKTNIIDLSEYKELQEMSFLQGKVIHLLTNQNFNSLYSARGRINIGHTAFENELNPASLKNSAGYDLILAASTWGKQKLIDFGVRNADALIQGIDPALFYPGDNNAKDNLFVIFSGGKFEYRKGQDLVLKAIKILQQKYSDIILVNAWYNLWPEVLQNMKNSAHINFELKGNTWEEIMQNIYNINGIDPKRIITLPLLPNNKLRELYLKTDIGLFPNRCEGGTNLVMMEYMACGKPVIASFNSGHMDIVNEQNAMLLKDMKEVKLFSEEGQLKANWTEPDVDEIICQIETAYHNRYLIKTVGENAAESMKNFTWEKTAENLLSFLSKYN